MSTGVSEDFLPGTLYTIRGWAYVDSLAFQQGLSSIGTIGSNADRTQIILNTDGSINFYSQGASQVFNITSAAGVITTGNWFSSRRFAIEPRHFCSSTARRSRTASRLVQKPRAAIFIWGMGLRQAQIAG